MELWQKQATQAGDPPPQEVPVALRTEGPHGPVIHATNRAARLAGVREGARVTDMQALCPGLRVEHADPEGDSRLLARLNLWMRRWCPWSAVDGTNGLVLDTTGADHLWGGEAAMLVDMETRLSRLGFSAQLALAPTWGAAWALARFGPVRAICHDTADLAPLPVAALRLHGDTALLLHRLGLKCVGDLAAMPRLSLARRFSRAKLDANPLLRLDQATGRMGEPLAPPDAPPSFRAIARLAEPIMDPAHHLPALCHDLCARLEAAGQGARRLSLCVYRTDGERRRIEVSTAAPSRDPAHLHSLFRDRLERIDPGFGFDLITLEAPGAEPLDQTQPMLGGRKDAALELPRLIDRLTARFGARALSRPAARQSHIPERAEVTAPLLAPPQDSPPLPNRPARLLDHPEEIRVLYAVPEGPPAQFVWRRQTHRVARYQGPERIAPEWWQDRPGTRLRDYFMVEDHDGRRLWLYREGLPADGRGGPPRWFLHGMFF
ncbi:MAG: DNA polymerase Y family protein [Paracoccaceae bacterium]